MGALWAKWRKKPSTSDILEDIRTEIRSIDEFKRDTAAWHKKLIGYLLAYFSVLYLVSALIAYFRYYHDPAWRDFASQFKLMLPFLVAPLMSHRRLTTKKGRSTLGLGTGGGLEMGNGVKKCVCLLYTSPSPRDLSTSRMPSSA